VLAEGLLFQTPIARKLPTADGRLLFDAFEDLLSQYDEGRLSAARLADMRAQYGFQSKCEAIRKKLGGRKVGVLVSRLGLTGKRRPQVLLRLGALQFGHGLVSLCSMDSETLSCSNWNWVDTHPS